jgi:hypothetical protein
MRILFIVSPNEQTIIDRLIVGLYRRSGALHNRLTVFPFKRNLYEADDRFTSYGLPLGGIPTHAGELVNMIKQGQYDVIFVGGKLPHLWLRSMYEFIFEAVGDLPCIVIWDEGESFRTGWKFRQLNTVCIFDRFHTNDRGDFPLGHGELRERMPESPDMPKRFDTFFAGTSRPIREEYLSKLRLAGYENLYSHNYPGGYYRYRLMLRQSRASFVFMQDHHLYRRSEGGAQGTCMFLRQNKKIIFRYDYTDGLNAIFYDSPEELLEKLAAVLSNSGQAEALGAAAFEHILTYHLVEHWADYVLKKCEERMP